LAARTRRPEARDFRPPEELNTDRLDNVLSVDAFVAATHGLDWIRFVEAPEVDLGPVHGPDGRYAHEFIVPCSRVVAGGFAQRPRRCSLRSPERCRRFEPGSEWLLPASTGPRRSPIAYSPICSAPRRDRLRAASLIDRWFFTRYRDPDRHLRVRFHGLPDQLLREVLPALSEVIAPALDAGLIYRVTVDTYEREVERYGGLEGVELMEAASEADSDAVLAVLGHSVNQAHRRYLAVASVAALYAQSGLDMLARHQCCDFLRRAFSDRNRSSLGTLLAADERAERSDLEAAVASLDDPGAPPTVQALRARSGALRPVLARFRAVHEAGRLEQPLTDVLCSVAHMFVNRFLREAGHRDELRVHDALARLYEGQLARERAGRPGIGTVKM
jgi:lantibiotic biosynthesis protein